MNSQTASIEELAIDTIRTLSMDAVQAANSGHPGTPMALAPVAYEIWANFLRYDPANPQWANRDRFVLSCGHASMLLYSLIHLTGVQEIDKNGKHTGKPAITLENIEKFRQIDSPCAGHPEFGYATGIETTTGPLGQGVGNSVGMAIASKHLSAKYNKPDAVLFDYNTYVLCSDGDLMEGISTEAASIAGHLKLDNLCWVYDDNKITIEGHTDLAFSENVQQKFEGLGWSVMTVTNANDLDSIGKAFEKFNKTTGKPTLIILKSVIGFGSPHKAGTHSAHGSPLGEDEIKLTKKAYGWPEEAKFLVPDDVPEHFAETLGKRGAQEYSDWQKVWAQYSAKYKTEAAEVDAIIKHELPKGWDANLKEFPADAKGMASRVSSGKVLNMLSPKYPALMGGSADLASSTMTLIDGEDDFLPDHYVGRNMHFGIREHGMASALNGMSLCGLRAYGATFFVFTDYCRPAIRLASIMHQPTLYVMTHDSIGLGEDGPTHQPVEHMAACRAIPGLFVYRPGDANEVLYSYKAAMQILDHPAMMVLSRQNLPTLDRSKMNPATGAEKGGYVLIDCDGTPDVILMASGSELIIVVKACEKLVKEGKKVRVVSLPCFELFEQQDQKYRDSVFPEGVKARVACEAGIRQGWDKYLGVHGKFVGMNGFGESGPYDELYKHFKITDDEVVKQAKSIMS